MKFVDEAYIDIAAGDGGNGCVSFRHEKYKEFGGPNGGDGGRGGHIYAVADINLNTLVDFRFSRRHDARNGEHGKGSDMFGAKGDDIILKMPVGTILTDAESGDILFELLVPGEEILIAKGGDGGFGNLRFKSSTNRAPRTKTPPPKPSTPSTATGRTPPSGFTCATCGHEWRKEAAAEVARVVKDAHGNVLADGDSVVLIKDLKLRGGSGVLKGGTKVRSIRLVEGDHEIDCKIDGSPMALKACFVKKA